MSTEQLLKSLNPEPSTVDKYREVEEISVERIIGTIKADQVDKAALELAKLCLKTIQSVNKTRTSLRSEMSLHVNLFKDISDDKTKLQAYVKATYPTMLKK